MYIAHCIFQGQLVKEIQSKKDGEKDTFFSVLFMWIYWVVPSSILKNCLKKKLRLHIVVCDFGKVEWLAIGQVENRFDFQFGIAFF